MNIGRLVMVFIIAIFMVTQAAAAAPTCEGEWYGYKDTYNDKNRDRELKTLCAPDGFSRFGPVKRANDCDPQQFNCLCENMEKTCMTVCYFEGKHADHMCGKPGKNGKGDATRVACCL